MGYKKLHLKLLRDEFKLLEHLDTIGVIMAEAVAKYGLNSKLR